MPVELRCPPGHLHLGAEKVLPMDDLEGEGLLRAKVIVGDAKRSTRPSKADVFFAVLATGL
eukprot:CAMPEP_0181446932 /NCGR_PEP_ID=MMETSP1110-20121109/26362_1 /TAXON_ID=174948 /ORGANISM="Symbiodinium sp., Strain CCMP421" /LENGTH=60 /DNA_ID=CAMNT_0023571031 /DNA_START=64 /DNA_END=246 /DNA_ORIENTATION=+